MKVELESLEKEEIRKLVKKMKVQLELEYENLLKENI
jgi:hypothetical protein